MGPNAQGIVIAQNYFANGISAVFVEESGTTTAQQVTLIGNRFQNFSREAVALGGGAIVAHNIFDTCSAWGLWLRQSARHVQIADNLFLSVNLGIGLPLAPAGPAIVKGNRFHKVKTPIAGYESGRAVALPADTAHLISGTLVEPDDSP